MTSLIKIPFASSGDKTAVPDTDSGGGVNMTQGYGQSYSLDPATDPSAKRIERDKMNWLFNRITSAINEIQIGGVAPFITTSDNGGTPFAYGKGAIVLLNGISYQSLEDANTTTPPGAKWNEVSGTGRLLGIKTFTSSTTYTPTPGTKMVIVEVQGAGGGGGGASASSSTSAAGGSGGAGGYAKHQITTPSTTNIVVGTGGSPGQPGGNSSFGTVVGNGGLPGVTNIVSGGISYNGHARGGDGGTATGGNLINAKGGASVPCFVLSGIPSGGNGGDSRFSGGAQGAGVTSSAGSNGILGSGGSGATANMTASSFAGGSGGNGVVVVWEYA